MRIAAVMYVPAGGGISGPYIRATILSLASSSALNYHNGCQYRKCQRVWVANS